MANCPCLQMCVRPGRGRVVVASRVLVTGARAAVPPVPYVSPLCRLRSSVSKELALATLGPFEFVSIRISPDCPQLGPPSVSPVAPGLTPSAPPLTRPRPAPGPHSRRRTPPRPGGCGVQAALTKQHAWRGRRAGRLLPPPFCLGRLPSDPPWFCVVSCRGGGGHVT